MTQTSVAVVQALQGFATVRDSEGGVWALQVGDHIHLGDTVQTGGGVFVVLQYGDQLTQTIGANAFFLVSSDAVAAVSAEGNHQSNPDATAFLLVTDVQPHPMPPPIFIAPRDEGQHSLFVLISPALDTGTVHNHSSVSGDGDVLDLKSLFSEPTIGTTHNFVSHDAGTDALSIGPFGMEMGFAQVAALGAIHPAIAMSVAVLDQTHTVVV